MKEPSVAAAAICILFCLPVSHNIYKYCCGLAVIFVFSQSHCTEIGL